MSTNYHASCIKNAAATFYGAVQHEWSKILCLLTLGWQILLFPL